MEELLAASRANDSGQKLEVNEKIIDSCTSLVQAIRLTSPPPESDPWNETCSPTIYDKEI